MDVGVRIYTTQAWSQVPPSPTRIFPSTRRNPPHIACRDRPVLHHSGAQWFGLFVRATSDEEHGQPCIDTQLFPSTTPPFRPVCPVEFLRRRALLVHPSSPYSAHQSTTGRSWQSIRTEAAEAPHTHTRIHSFFTIFRNGLGPRNSPILCSDLASTTIR